MPTPVIADAKDALVAADALEARKDNPVSMFISAKTGRLIAKLGFAQVLDVPVTISRARQAARHARLHRDRLHRRREGAAMERRHHEAVGHGTVLAPQEAPARGRGTCAAAGHDADAATALERIEIPKETAELLAELMKPGSSFIISDYGLSRETSARTEFVVEPWRSRTDSAEPDYEGSGQRSSAR